MNPDAPTAVLNTAGSQRDRWRPALGPGYARPDDRSLPELIDFAARFGRLINYFDLENTVHGDWSAFFAHDPVLVLASIARTDVARMERELTTLARTIREERTEERRRALFDRLFESALELPRRIDRWLDAMDARDDSPTARLVHARIAADIRDTLGDALRRIRAWDAVRPASHGRDYASFGPYWSLHAVQADQVVGSAGADLERVDGAAPSHILGAWQPMADAVARWAVDAPGLIAAILDEDNGRHRPHVALFVAFVHLLAIAQESINEFSTRRADFYFRRVLRDANLGAEPDSVYVAFDAAASPAPMSVAIPAHTRLLAGTDAQGRQRTFVSCDDLTVTDATLAMVRTVRRVTGPLLPGAPGQVVERIVSQQLTRDEANAAGFATFGQADDEPAAIGFAVATPVLWLRAGRRSVGIEIRCAPGPLAGNEVLNRLSAATGLDNDQILRTLLEGAFALSVSTRTGWLPVDAYAVDLLPGRGNPGFALRFTLGADEPPVAPFPESPLALERPAVRVHLRQQRVALAEGRVTLGVYPLSVLAGLTIAAVDVRVQVEGLVPASVEISLGLVDTTKPFPVFGAVPAVGSYLRLREPELFVKDPSALALRIRWFALPADETGFHGYYRGYVIGPNGLPQEGLFDNQVFRAAVMVEGSGVPGRVGPAGGSEHHLFCTVAGSTGPIPDPDRQLSNQTLFAELPIPSTQAVGNAGETQGSIRLELIAPSYAFGNSLYAQNVLHAATPVGTDAACEASCQAEYAFLLQAARSLESVLPPLSQTGIRGRVVEASRAFRGLRTRAEAVASNKTATLDRLADVAHESLAACLADWQGLLAPQEVNALQAQLAECRRGAALDRLSACAVLRARLQAAAAEVGADAASPRLERCDLALLAGSWVWDSDAGYADDSEWSYRRTVRTNLTKCILELRARHDSAVKACKDRCLHGEQRQVRPNPPYLPQAEALSFDYSASGPATVFAHLLPFDGHRQVDPDGPDVPALLPAFAYAGNLYLGFSRLDGPRTLPLYLRMGQARGVEPPAISWACLTANRWLSLPSPSGADGTRGLQTSGIVTLSLPPSQDLCASTVLPGGLRWIRAALVERPADVPRVLAIYAQAVRATRQAAGDEAGGADLALPPRTITALAKPVKGIGGVTQPAASFGGRAAESDRAFSVRMSERLRHKNRAIVAWDYERLVLECFPTVWKVRTLPARARRIGEQEGGAGAVRVIVVPGPTSPEVVDPTAPTSSADTLASIAQVLQQAAGPFVRVQVLNPIFVRMRVTATVRWRDREDPRMLADRLSGEIRTYLSPWPSEVRGDRAVSEPELAEFIQSRSYVDLVTAIAVGYDPAEPLASEPECCFLTTAAVHEIRAEAAVAASVQEGY